MKKVLIGFIAGVTVGMLYAPTDGKTARKKIANLSDNMKEGWDTIADAVSARVNNEEEEKYDRYPADQPGMIL